MWEILVPKCMNDGSEWSLYWHNEWDDFVLKISHGMTILRSAKGRWRHSAGQQEEQMIPVRVICSPAEMTKIARFTKEHYEQKVVLFYRVSNEVYFI